MNRSTCRDALAVADNGQQLNKGNELKKKVKTTLAATVQHPAVAFINNGDKSAANSVDKYVVNTADTFSIR